VTLFVGLASQEVVIEAVVEVVIHMRQLNLKFQLQILTSSLLTRNSINKISSKKLSRARLLLKPHQVGLMIQAMEVC
jgi:hypothetical protein